VVSGGVLRKLGQVAAEVGVYQELADEPDLLIGDHELVDLDGPGVEAFVGRKISWQLNVQGVTIEVEAPTIKVSDALTRAGFDVAQSWHICICSSRHGAVAPA